jgi:hypothetical protein
MNVHINDNKLLVVVEDDHSKHILHHLLDLFNKKKRRKWIKSNYSLPVGSSCF